MKDLIYALAGLGLFLYGMSVLEEAVKSAAGNNLKTFIQNSTKSNLRSVFTGFVSTTILQSSTVVTMMSLAFVGAGLMSLNAGIGVVLGSNIGTALTTAIIGVVGFKTDFTTLVMPLIGIGGVGQLIFAKRNAIKQTFVGMIGLSLLFLGLDFMKEGMSSWAKYIDFSNLNGQNVLILVVLGFLISAIVQSSTAATAILLSTMQTANIDLKVALGIIIGINIGTTLTAAIGSFGGSADKKRVVTVHIMFNVITALGLLILFVPVSNLWQYIYDKTNDLTLSVLGFHVFFNVAGVLVLTWFIPLYTVLLKRLFNEKQKIRTEFIHNVNPEIGSAAIVALQKETLRFFKLSLKLQTELIKVLPSKLGGSEHVDLEFIEKYTKHRNSDEELEYTFLYELESNILNYVFSIESANLTPQEQKQKESISQCIREIGEALKIMKDTSFNLDSMAQNHTDFIQRKYNKFRFRLFKLINSIYRTLEEGLDVQEIQINFEDIKHQDTEALGKISKAVKEEKLSEIDAPQILSANRGVYLVSKSLITATDLITSI